jgi:DNA-binding NarL/FixJ family response regulator
LRNKGPAHPDLGEASAFDLLWAKDSWPLLSTSQGVPILNLYLNPASVTLSESAMPVSQPSERITVVLLAENRLLREALFRILNRKSGIRVVASFCFSEQALKLVAAAAPRVLLLDADSLSCSGGHIMRETHEELPATKVVVMGGDPDGETFLRIVRSGAVGYLTKDASPTEIEAAVCSVVAGEAVCPPKLCLTLFSYVAGQGKQIPGFYGKLQFGLTGREQQLVMMMGRGLRNKEIADELNLSDQTVKHHVHHVLRKLGARDRLSAVEVCRLHGMSV